MLKDKSKTHYFHYITNQLQTLYLLYIKKTPKMHPIYFHYIKNKNKKMHPIYFHYIKNKKIKCTLSISTT